MWLKFKMRLGKMVQGALNIFRKKKKYERECGFLQDACEFTLTGGKWTINDTPIEVKFCELESGNYEAPTLNFDYNKPITFTMDDCDFNINALEKLCNTPLTILPRRIHVPTLIVSTFANWDYDSIGVDLSQLDEKGIAHFFCTSTKSMEEHLDEYKVRFSEAEDLEIQEESASVVVPDAVLVEWPGGYWEWEC